MKAKEYLRTIRSEQRELKTLIERRQTLYFSVLPSGIQYDKDLIKSTLDDHMVDKLMKKMELDEVIDKYIVMLTTHKAEAMKIIKEIDNSLYRQVLINYYIIPKDNGKPRKWDDVANEIYRGERQTKRIHGEALIEFQKKFEKIEKSC